MGDEIDGGRVFFRATVDGDEDAPCIRNDVGVGEDFIFSDEEAGADATAEATGIPRSFVVRDLGGHFNAEDGLVNV